MTSILHHKADKVGYITLNRPDKYNSVNREMALRLQAVLDEFAADDPNLGRLRTTNSRWWVAKGVQVLP